MEEKDNIQLLADYIEDLDLQITGVGVITLGDMHRTIRKNIETLRFTSTCQEPFNFNDLNRSLLPFSNPKIHSQKIYCIKVEYSGHTFIIKKTYRDFNALHKEIFKNPLRLIKNLSSEVPKLPNEKDKYISRDEMLESLIEFLILIRDKFAVEDKKNFMTLKSFLSIEFNLQEHSLFFIKCGKLRKKLGTRKVGNCFKNFWLNVCKLYRKKIFVLTQDGLCYMTKSEVSTGNTFSDIVPSDYILFDKDINISTGERSTQCSTGFLISTNTRNLKLKADTYFEFIDWILHLSEAIIKSPYARIQRYNSFSPIRENNFVHAYVNGYEYYSDVYDMINKAEYEIFITDWWLSPELYLKRPVEDHEDSRLDVTLQRAAQRGVKIHILVYKEFAAMTNLSIHVQNHLNSLHPNIEVLRHPPKLVF